MLDGEGKVEMVATIIEESERLNRFIANLLDMTRLESGSIEPNMAPHDIGEIVGSVLERARKILAHHRVEVDIAPDLPMLALDPVLFEQVLFNLLDNAAKYASPETTVLIQSWQEGANVKLQVVDEGSGVPPEELDQIFEEVHRAQRRIGFVGTGLGLSISAAGCGSWVALSPVQTGSVGKAPCSRCAPYQPTERLDTAA